MNVWTNEESAVITAELPGVNSEEIDISVVGDTLTLSGNRQLEELGEGDKYHRRERSYGKFTRTFELPFLVEADKVEAVFEKGVLHISLPRAEADKPKKIAVKTAAVKTA
jgi:HSP20 family protein